VTAATLWADTTTTGNAVPVVCGIDTSITATGIASSAGWCIVRGYTNREFPFTKLAHRDRIRVLTGLAAEICEQAGTPDLAVIETPAYAKVGGASHERGWLWWDIYRRLTAAGVPIALMTPNQRMLYATGKGSGNKGGVIDAVARRWPAFATGGNDNLADAVTLMAAGMDALGHPLASVPQAHHKALDAVEWPTVGGAA
jgi:crossover junction endodeoxyribonuclease RuvC